MDDKLEPDVAKILRETTPEKVAERRRKALADLEAAGGDRASRPAPKADAEGAFEVPKPKLTRAARMEAARRSWKLVLACAVIAVAAPVAMVVLTQGREPAGSSDSGAGLVTAAPRASAVEPRASASGPEPRASASGAEPQVTATASASTSVDAGAASVVTAKRKQPNNEPDDPYSGMPPAKTAAQQAGAAPVPSTQKIPGKPDPGDDIW